MSNALEEFKSQLEFVDQLIMIHSKLQSGPGRRHEQDALHRAGVVLVIAAWQAYVEKLLEEGLEVISASLQDPIACAPAWSIQAFNLRKAQIKVFIKKFNTPDDVKFRDLLNESVGFNPWPAWEWRQGRRQWGVKEVRVRTNTWVHVRHAVAHGFNLPNDVQWLKGENGQPRLTKGLLEECRRHFLHLSTKTDEAFAEHLSGEYSLPRPW